jgi:hypothetical protein
MTFLCTPDLAVNREGKKNTITPVRCKRWSCEHCAEMNRRRIIGLAKRGQPTAMLTLTLRSTDFETPDIAARELIRGLTALRRRIARRWPGQRLSFIAVFEKHKSGYPHLHLLIRAPFMPITWLKASWEEITGSFQVYVSKISTIGHAALYCAKYIGKDLAAFEGCKRWWRSHDYNDAADAAQRGFTVRSQWRRWEGNVDTLTSVLRYLKIQFEQKPDGRITWTDPPSGAISAYEIPAVAAAWFPGRYRAQVRSVQS